jgi:hypothetical protein
MRFRLLLFASAVAAMGSVGVPDATAVQSPHSTGLGQIDSGGHAVSIGFNASADPLVKGSCDVLDRDQQVHIVCLDATFYSPVPPNFATWMGLARVNGQISVYRIVVSDGGTTGDTFSISTFPALYSAAGPVTHGNIEIHNGIHP